MLLSRDLINHDLVVLKSHVKLPCRFFLSHGLLDFLFFEVLALKLLSLLLRKLHLLDLRCLLCSDSLELHSGTLVAKLWDRISQIQLNPMLLVNVIESELYDNLAERGVLLRLLNSRGSPDHVDDLGRVPLLVALFSQIAQGEWDAQALVARTMLLLSLLVNRLGLEWVHHFVLGHVYEHLTSRLCILCLHDKAFLRLNYCAAFWIDVRLSVFGTLSVLRLQLVEGLAQLWGTIPTLDVLVNFQQLCVRVLRRRLVVRVVHRWSTTTAAILCSIRVEARIATWLYIAKTHGLRLLVNLSEELVHFKFELRSMFSITNSRNFFT